MTLILLKVCFILFRIFIKVTGSFISEVAKFIEILCRCCCGKFLFFHSYFHLSFHVNRVDSSIKWASGFDGSFPSIFTVHFTLILGRLPLQWIPKNNPRRTCDSCHFEQHLAYDQRVSSAFSAPCQRRWASKAHRFTEQTKRLRKIWTPTHIFATFPQHINKKCPNQCQRTQGVHQFHQIVVRDSKCAGHY